MSSTKIAMVMVEVDLQPPSKRKKTARNSSIAMELSTDSCRVWDEVQCGELYHFTEPEHGLPSKFIIELPQFDEVFRYLTGQYAMHRRDPLGDFLHPIVAAMETALAVKVGSCVYFAQADHRIKIGWSKQVATRVTQLQTGNGAPIRLLGVIPGGLARERAIHAQFADERLGGEWFEATDELLAFIEKETRTHEENP